MFLFTITQNIWQAAARRRYSRIQGRESIIQEQSREQSSFRSYELFGRTSTHCCCCPGWVHPAWYEHTAEPQLCINLRPPAHALDFSRKKWYACMRESNNLDPQQHSLASDFAISSHDDRQMANRQQQTTPGTKTVATPPPPDYSYRIIRRTTHPPGQFSFSIISPK